MRRIVGARGIEPLLKEPKSFVLPLYDTPIQLKQL